MSKPFSELTLEELMEIAKKPIQQDKFKALPPAKRFIMSEGIVPGPERIPAILIYDRYIKWAKAYKVKPVSQPKFYEELALHFDKVRIANGFAYLMNPKGFNLSPDYLLIAKKQHTNGRRNSQDDKTKKERTTKKPRKAVSTEKP